jgi:hypothetical protein
MTRPTAAGRRGFFPGDDLSQMPSGGRQIQWLKISRITGYREYLHDPQTGTSHNLLTGRAYHDRYTRAAWAELIRSLTEEGFREPLKLEYEPDSRHAYLGEGNHRLVAAGLAGYTAVPVWGLRGYGSERMRQARRVPGEPELTRENGRGYFPSSFRPSDVLPRSYLYLGQDPQFCNRCSQEFPRGKGPEHVAGEHPAEWRQAWERNPGLRKTYPHLAPRTAAAQDADPGLDIASWLSLPPGRDAGTALIPAVPRPPAITTAGTPRQTRPGRLR